MNRTRQNPSPASHACLLRAGSNSALERTSGPSRRSTAWAHRALFLLCLHANATAGESDHAPTWRPSAWLTQVGAGRHVNAVTVGARWDLSWTAQWRIGRVSSHFEAVLGAWDTNVDEGRRWFTHAGLTPTIRVLPSGWAQNWFVEAGIGLHLISPRYVNAGKEFSTRLNFGEHVGIGFQFGDQARHELILRIQHFSNASLKKPNPGENFLQVQYVSRF